MIGAGAHVFALMGYVIANYKPDKTVGGQVRLNPALLAAVFGEPESRVQEAIDYLCKPDARSTTPAEEGRRLVKIGQFDYRVVNAKKYLEIRNEEERREQNRINQQNHRNKKPKSTPIAGEPEYVEALRAGATPEKLDAIVSDNLPKPKMDHPVPVAAPGQIFYTKR